MEPLAFAAGAGKLWDLNRPFAWNPRKSGLNHVNFQQGAKADLHVCRRQNVRSLSRVASAAPAASFKRRSVDRITVADPRPDHY
jgi:hypothetical protein